jgi:hypothetical protein
MKRLLTTTSFVLAIVAAVFVWVWPLYYDSSGRHKTLGDVNGPWALIPVAFPIFITALPLTFPNQAVRVTASVVLGLFVFLGGMTIGLFYLPAAVLLMLAACAADSASQTR